MLFNIMQAPLCKKKRSAQVERQPRVFAINEHTPLPPDFRRRVDFKKNNFYFASQPQHELLLISAATTAACYPNQVLMVASLHAKI